MKVNSDKTTLLCISNTRQKTSTFIKDGAETYRSDDSLKLLGFQFGSNTGIENHLAEMKKGSIKDRGH